MPRLRQYISQEASRGRALNPSRVTPQGVETAGLVRGLSQVSDTLQQLQEVQRRESEKLAADEARMQVANTMSEGMLMWQERMQKAQTEAPKGAAGFTEGTLKEFDNWAKQRTDGAMHPEGRRLLEDNLRKMRAGLNAEAFKFEVGQRNKALVSDFDAGLNTDRKAVMAAPSSFPEIVARRVATAQAMSLPAETRDKLVSGAREALAFDAANGLVDQDAAGFLERAGMRSAKGRKGTQGGQEQDAAARVAADPILSSLSPEKLRATVDRASMLVAQQEQARDAARLRALAEQDRRLRQAEAEAKAIRELYELGVMISPKEIESALAATVGTPYQALIRSMGEASKNAGALASRSIAEQQATVDALNTRIASEGASRDLVAQRDAAVKVLDGSKQGVEKDPLRAGVRRGWITEFQPVQFGGGIDALVQQVQARAPLADAVGQRAGRPVSPLTGDETKTLFARVAGQPAAQRAQTLATLTQAMPQEQAQALAAQLDAQSKGDQGRMFAAALSAGASKLTDGTYTMELILKGGEALQDKTIKEEKTPVDGWKGRISKITGEAYRNREEARFIADKARFILAGLVSEGASGSENDVSRAINMAAGGWIREHNGARIPLPAGVEPSAFRDKIRATKPEALGLPDGMVYVNTGAGVQSMPAADFLATLPQAKLTFRSRVNDRTNLYYVQAGSSFVAKANGDPVVIEVGP